MAHKLSWFAKGSFPLYLAPMAGFTDVAFRQLCKEQGADVMVTEFVCADALMYGVERAWNMVDFTEEQRPMGVQIFGSSPRVMADAAVAICKRMQPDFIDLNFGCPADKVTDTHAGSSLLKDPQRLFAVAEAVVQAVPDFPVTAKIRIGWDKESIVAVEVSQLLEKAGVSAVAVHGRTKKQGYSGEADWGVIEAVAKALSIPVIGNGNIQTVDDVKRLREETSVSGFMIGRAALGYPWVFREIKGYSETGEIPEPPTLEQRWETLLRYANLLLDRPLGGQQFRNFKNIRSRLIKITKVMKGGKIVRQALSTIDSYEGLQALAKQHLEEFG